MSTSATSSSSNSLPAVTGSARDVGGLIERVISHVPAPKTHQVPDPTMRARLWARISDFLLRHLGVD